MEPIDTAALREQLTRVIGPAPWYWKTFPTVDSPSGRYSWIHHGEQGPLGYLVSLSCDQETDRPCLALNTYARPFLISPARLGIWSPEGRNLRFTCFDPGKLQPFDFAEIAGWFKQSGERIYSATEPVADFEVSIDLRAGTHKIDVPAQFELVEELIVPTTYPTKNPDDPAMALFVFYFQAGLVEVLPQRWFTAAQYQVGPQWITRAARHLQSQRIFGECFGTGSFLLQEDGVRLERWIHKPD